MLATESAASHTGLAFHAGMGKMPSNNRSAPTESTSPAMLHSALTDNPLVEKMETRFGAVEINRSLALTFEHGLLGVPSSRHFALIDFPNPSLAQFKLLQSLDAPSLSFITLPLDADNNFIERADLEKAAKDTNLDLASVAILLVVSVHRSPGETKISVNARAPLMIDSTTRYGMQYVFQHSRYKVQHVME